MSLKDGQDQVSGPQVPGDFLGDNLGAVLGDYRGDRPKCLLNRPPERLMDATLLRLCREEDASQVLCG